MTECLTIQKRMNISVKHQKVYDELFFKLGRMVNKLNKKYPKLHFLYDWSDKKRILSISVEGNAEDVNKFIELSKFQKTVMSTPAMKNVLTVDIV